MAKKKILKENGKEILPITHEKCVLDNNGVSLAEKIGNMDDLMADSDDLVSAINEVTNFNNNFKGLIADSIGSPISADDSFNDIRNDINSLLNQFKTNMMNAGVVVESGDKFESLIEKIKGLTEGEGNKGIQYATGTASAIPVNGSITITMNLDFNPTVVFCHFPIVGFTIGDNNTYKNLCICSLYPTMSDNYASAKHQTIKLTNLTKNSFKLTASPAWSDHDEEVYTEGDISWYAIGVGEEDTTLRDSLADILENKGVEVSPDDDLADLIGKVDSINSGGLDIIAATELPATGRENQICVITDNPVNNYVFSKEQPSDVEIGLLWFKVEDYNTINTHYSPMIGDNINIQYYLRKCFYYNGSSFVEVNGYIYNNGWKSLSKGYVFIDKDGLHNFKLLYDNGGYASSIPGEGVYFNIENFNGSTRYESQWVSQTKVDFSNYTSLTFSFTITAPSGNWSYEGFVCCGYGTTTLDNYFHSQGYWDNGDIEYFTFSGEDDPAYSGEQINLTLDISRINTKCYVGIEFAAYLATEITLTSITLT